MSTSETTCGGLQSLAKALEENANFKWKLALQGNTSSFEFRGMKIIVSPTTPPFVSDGETISVLDATPKE